MTCSVCGSAVPGGAVPDYQRVHQRPRALVVARPDLRPARHGLLADAPPQVVLRGQETGVDAAEPCVIRTEQTALGCCRAVELGGARIAAWQAAITDRSSAGGVGDKLRTKEQTMVMIEWSMTARDVPERRADWLWRGRGGGRDFQSWCAVIRRFRFPVGGVRRR